VNIWKINMTTIILSFAGALLVAAVICLVVIFGKHGVLSFHEIPKLAKQGDRLAKAYLWCIYCAFGIFCFSFIFIRIK
jgi:hypothetical protein